MSSLKSGDDGQRNTLAWQLSVDLDKEGEYSNKQTANMTLNCLLQGRIQVFS